MMNYLYMIFNLTIEVIKYTDLTGCFQHQYSRDHNYICIAYNYGGNVILVEVINGREADTVMST